MCRSWGLNKNKQTKYTKELIKEFPLVNAQRWEISTIV